MRKYLFTGVDLDSTSFLKNEGKYRLEATNIKIWFKRFFFSRLHGVIWLAAIIWLSELIWKKKKK